MNYTDQLAEQVIQQYGLGRTARYRWEAAGKIPDIYFTNGFVKSKPLTKLKRSSRRLSLRLLIYALIRNKGYLFFVEERLH